jgi:hypothetical protein
MIWMKTEVLFDALNFVCAVFLPAAMDLEQGY